MKKITVKYLSTQGAEDLFYRERYNKVYVRQPSNNRDIVLWYTVSKWSGACNPDCHIRSGVTMSVVDADGKILFEEEMEPDEWESGTSAKKVGLFLSEALRKEAEELAERFHLKAHTAWRRWLMSEKTRLNNNDYDDTWLYKESECLESKVVEEVNLLGAEYVISAEKCRHTVCGKEWEAFLIQSKKDRRITAAICGYLFEEPVIESKNSDC